MEVMDPYRPVSAEIDFCCGRASDYGQLRPCQGRVQVGSGTAPASAVLLGELIETASFMFSAVEIGIARDAGCGRGFDEKFGKRMSEDVVCNIERSTSSMKWFGESLVVFGFLKVGKNFVVTPARVPESLPTVKITCVATGIDHVINRAGAAQRAPARPGETPKIAVHLRHSSETPIVLRIRQHRHHRRNVDVGRVISS